MRLVFLCVATGLAGLVLAVSATGAVSSSRSSQADSSTLTELVSTFGNGQFLPRATNEGPANEAHMVFATLLTERNGHLAPGLASSWTASPDAKTWTFTMRKGLTFQNGQPVTAADAAFSLLETFGPSVLKDSTTTGANVAVARELLGVTSSGNTVRMRFKVPLPYFGDFVSGSLAGSIEGAVFPKSYFLKVGRQKFNHAPIGAGPWKLIQQSSQSMKFQRFDGYYDKSQLSKFEFLKVNLVPELATRVEALTSGSADIVQVDTSVVSQVTGAHKKLVYSPESNYIFDQWQSCWKPAMLCHNARVRQALDLALNKKLIMSQLYGASWQDAGWQMAMPGALGYRPDLSPGNQDIAKAKALLAAAGYPGGKGMPTVTINVISDSAAIPRLPDFAQLVAQEWKQELGVNTNVKVSDFASLDSRQGTGALDGSLYIRDNQGRYDGGSFLTSLYSGDVTNPNALSKNPALTSLISKMNAAVAPAARATAYHNLYWAARAADYEMGFGSLSNVWAVSSRVSGWKPLPLNGNASGLWTISVK